MKVLCVELKRVVFKIKHNHEELIDVLIDEAQIVCLGMRYFSLGGQEITVFDFGS